MSEAKKYVFENESKRSVWILVLLTLVCFISLWYFSEKYSNRNDDKYSVNQIQTQLNKKTDALSHLLKTLDISEKATDISLHSLMEIKNEIGCDLFFMKDDSVKYWTTSLISIEEINLDNQPIIKLNNGWYKTVYSESKPYTLISLIPIKIAYNYNNEFLAQSFNEDFNVYNYYDISLEQGDHNIWAKDGSFLFSIHRTGSQGITNSQAFVLFVLFHVLVILVLIIITKLYEKSADFIKPIGLRPLLLIADVFILWAIINYTRIPHILFDSPLYSPFAFADQSHASIANYFTNVLLLLYLIYVLFTKRYLLNAIFLKSKYVGVGLLFILVVIALLFFERAAISLFKNSLLTYQFGQDFMTNPGLSTLIFLILSILSLCLFLLVQAFVFELKKLELAKKNVIILGLFLFSLIIVLFYYITSYFMYISLFLFLLLVSMWLKKNSKYNAIQLMFYLVLFSVFMSVLSAIILDEKEITEKKIISEKLVGNKDPLAEYEFLDIEKNVYADDEINNKIYTPLNDSIEKIIVDKIKHYFSKGSWKKYTSYVTVCDSTKVLNIQPENYLINCSDYFKNFINTFGEPEINESLVHLKSSTLNNAYIASFIFRSENNKHPDKQIFVELISEFIQEGVGYTEIFADESNEIKAKDIINYSFAKYSDDELIYKFGSYYYNLSISEYADYTNDSGMFEHNGFNHLVYTYEDGHKLIISRPLRKFWERIAPFSYFFILFSLFILMFSIIINVSSGIFQTPLSFRKRIQFSFTGIILFSFLVIGTVTLFYIVDINNNKNKEILSEKAHSVLVELEHKLSTENSLPIEMTEYLNSLLKKFADVFFSDINLYDLEGRMIATSRPRIIEEGLISPLMNPVAYSVLTEQKKLLFIQNESIGEYKYLSAYIPFRNSENQLIAYLNLPYFARQSEIQKEITTFLVALVNIYLLFFVLAIIIALFISRNMSKPLELIRMSIGQIKLGEINEKIQWQREDEIGALIKEYNWMIGELSKSAELLAKSERESAWREMAKQVAHEIKNPLTPMKLSVQYLKKRWDDKSPDWDEHLERFSTTIVQQIDILSEIASAFSDFAKMPKKKNEIVDINDIILKSMELFKEHKNLQINFKSENQEYLISGDKNQLLRVFNNLIKNSIQAIKNKNEGEVDIHLSVMNENCLVSVKDNGVGIPEERKGKIFTPSFTTKSSGMGLGLSIVKSIVIDSGGKIWFESEEKVGTTFYIQFPIYKDEK